MTTVQGIFFIVCLSIANATLKRFLLISFASVENRQHFLIQECPSWSLLVGRSQFSFTVLTGRNRKVACASSLFSGLVIWEELWLWLHIVVRKRVASFPNTLIFRFALTVFPGVCVSTLHLLLFSLQVTTQPLAAVHCGFSLLWPPQPGAIFLQRNLRLTEASERTEPERILYSFADNFKPINNASTQALGRNAGDFMTVKPRCLPLNATLLIHLVPVSCQVLPPDAIAGGDAGTVLIAWSTSSAGLLGNSKGQLPRLKLSLRTLLHRAPLHEKVGKFGSAEVQSKEQVPWNSVFAHCGVAEGDPEASKQNNGTKIVKTTYLLLEVVCEKDCPWMMYRNQLLLNTITLWNVHFRVW